MLAWLLVAGQVVSAVPARAGRVPKTASPDADAQSRIGPPSKPPALKVNRTAPKVEPVSPYPVFSDAPTDQEISRARVFGEPLVSLGGTASSGENRALASALMRFLRTPTGNRHRPLEEHLKDHQGSAWNASLLMNLGAFYRRHGYFGRANGVLRQAWEQARTIDSRPARAVADGALKELLEMHSDFGHAEELEALVKEAEGRTLMGSAVEALQTARASLWVFANAHETAIPSGPVALKKIHEQLHPGTSPPEDLDAFHADADGATLVEMRDLARRVGLELRIALRSPGTDIPLPAVMHLRGAHFSAVLAEEGGRYRLEDPLLSAGQLWMDREALEEEASGFFLVPEGPLPAGWTLMADDTANEVRGKCKLAQRNFGSTKSGGPGANPTTGGNRGGAGGSQGGDCGCQGMATYSFHRFLVNLHLADIPVGYTPPRGPGVQFRVTYNHKEYGQPTTFSFANLGSRWNFDWLAYIEDDPANLSADVKMRVRGGGLDTHSGFSGQSYAPHRDSQGIVSRVSTSPIKYEHVLPDGSKEVYAQSDGAMASPRRVFLTEIVDPQGNKLTMSFDSQLRLMSVTDAIGQVTTLSYELGSDPLKVTKVTDPFGRSATLTYGSDGQLAAITDVIGLKSEFTYGSGDFVSALTTPYGTTTFALGLGPINWYTDWFLEATDPLGGKERIESVYGNPNMPSADPANTIPAGFSGSNLWLNNHNTYYFDKRAMALFPGDYTKAQVTRFNFTSTYQIWDSASSTKSPLENRVWYQYAQSPYAHGVGPQNKPIKVARVMADGQTQLQQFQYNARGSRIRTVDPLGRETVYVYGTNNIPDANPTTGDGIDLLQVKQKNPATSGGYDLLSSYTYNANHWTLTSTDTSGETTTYTYTPTGEVQTVTNAKNETTTYTYYPNGTLHTVTGPLAGTTTTYEYDGHGRLWRVTDPEGYATLTEYDLFDRPTKVTYPNGTWEETVYERLDAVKRKDRLGRWTQTFHDALRRPIAVKDAAGRMVQQQHSWEHDTLVDANGNKTKWQRDMLGRVVVEERANGAQYEYAYEPSTGQLLSITDPKGNVKTSSYNLDGTLAGIGYALAAGTAPTPNVSFTYDPAYNRVATMTDGTGTTSYAYNPVTAPPALGAGKLRSVDGPLVNDTIEYGYDELGRVTSRQIGSAANTQTQAFDVLGRLTTLTNPLGSFTYSYEGNTGRPASLTYPNGQQTTWAYFDNLGDHRLREIHNKRPGGATLSRFEYTYDTAGNILTWLQQADSDPAKVYHLGYDPADQLTSAILKSTDPTPVTFKRYYYSYDSAGNRTAEQIDDSVTGAAYNNMNQLLSQQAGGALVFKGTVSEPATVTVGGKPATVGADNRFEGQAVVPSGTGQVAVSASDPSGNVRTSTYQVSQGATSKGFTYDLNGNMTSDGTRTYEWDAENRLVAVREGTPTIASFTYNKNGMRFSKTASGVTVNFVVEGWSIVEERASTGGVTKHLHGLGLDDVLAIQDGSGVTYLTRDHLGSIRERVDAGGTTVVQRREYDPWGRISVSGGNAGGWAFTGREYDLETGLYYYRARYYDPSVGRFVSSDPLGREGESNPFVYVSSRPTVRSDPSGRKAPDYNPSAWNSEPYVSHNNCYLYAWNKRLAPPFRGPLDPGQWSGVSFGSLTCSDIKAAAIADGFRNPDDKGCCQDGYHCVKLYISTDVHIPGPGGKSLSLGIPDYHWYRRDSNGKWSSKHGTTKVKGQVDDPDSDANAWNYTTRCGGLCAPDK